MTMKQELSEPDMLYMDKLICDGVILTPENRDELNGMNSFPMVQQWDEMNNNYQK